MMATLCGTLLSSLLPALLLFVASPSVVRADTYVFDGGHTTVHLSWNHAGLSRNSARIVGAKGSLVFDPGSVEQSQLYVTIDPAELSTGVPALDRLLRGPDFFDVLNYPKIEFRSVSAKASGERIGEVVGDLTIRGVRRPVTLAVTWNFSGEHPLGLLNPSFAGKYVSAFSAKTKILRSEWGLGQGAPLISDDIEIAIETEMVRRQ